MDNKRKIEIEILLEYLIVLLLILTSGAQFFTVYKAMPTYMLLVVLGAIYFSMKRRIHGKNIIIVSVSCGIVLISSLLGGLDRINDMFKFYIAMFVLLIIQSNISSERFKTIYTNIMIGEAILSLVCFTYITLLKQNQLPFQFEQYLDYGEGEYNIVYLTFYYTLGWLSTAGYFHRNAGCFWEPGAHQIFLNIALLFILGKKDIELKEKIFAGIFIITIISTQSTTGYICLFITMFTVIVARFGTNKLNLKKGMLKKITCLGVLILIATIAVFRFGILDKLIYQTGSFGTRMNDTISGFMLTFLQPVFGNGYTADLTDLYSSKGIFNNSNGIVGLIMRLGYPIAVLYFSLFLRRIKVVFDVQKVQYVLLIVLFLIFMCTEAIYYYPVFLSFLLEWKKEHVQVKKSIAIKQVYCFDIVE